MALRDEVVIGKKYNYLTITKLLEPSRGAVTVECRCDCGRVKNYSFSNVKRSTSKSCGCYKVKKMSSF